MNLMSLENTPSTYDKAVSQDKEAKEAMKTATTFGEKVSLIEGTTALLYRGEKGKGLLLDFHGGGFCFKSPLDNDAYCSFLNKTYGLTVLNFDFTSSCYKTYPAQLLEAKEQYIGLLRRFSDFQTEKLYLVGHSSGANLAAALTLMLRREGVAVAGLVLDYPYLDLTRDPSSRPVYPETFPDWLITDWTTMYCPYEELRHNPLVSPLLMGLEDVSLFPKTFIVTSETDRLHDDGVAFYELLNKDGIDVVHFRALERHGFIERGMRSIFLAPNDPKVQYAEKITKQEFDWLL
jgi:acetyl esterase